MSETYDLVVIGGGPGGYVAAIRGAQLGLKVACIEKESSLGGTCLRVGCIPSKALLESSHLFHDTKHRYGQMGIEIEGVKLNLEKMQARKQQIVSGFGKGVEGLLKKNNIKRYQGTGHLAGPGKVQVEGQAEISASKIILATGSRVAHLPGVKPDGARVGTSTEALAYSEVPKHLVVIGGGYIGMELGSVWLRLGSRVTVLEFLDRILPGSDAEIAAEALKIFQRQGFEIHLGKKVEAARTEGDQAVVQVAGEGPITCDQVLLAVGRWPYTEGLGLESVGLKTDERGRIPVDQHYQTSVPGIYAIGDCIPGPMLAHKAEEEGAACVEQMVTGYGHVNYDVIPSVVYTHPEIAAVGKTEEELQKAGIPYKKGTFPYRANARAKTLNESDGFVKILAHQETDRVLGVHILGGRAGDMIAEATAAMEFGASSEDIARTCHAHPTLSEITKEAAMAVEGRAIHF